jgi:hypothetical protein
MGLAIFALIGEAIVILFGVTAVVVVQIVGKRAGLTVFIAFLFLVWFCWSIFPALPIYRHLCREQSGEVVVQRVKAQSYLLVGEGGDRFDGMGLRVALDDLANRRVAFVEIQEIGSQLQAMELVELGIRQAGGQGLGAKPRVFRLSITDAHSSSCRLYQRADHPIGARLAQDECVSLSEVAEAASRYVVTLFERPAIPMVAVTHRGISVEDRMTHRAIGKISVFEIHPRPLFAFGFNNKDVQCPASRVRRQPSMRALHGYVLFSGV